MIDPITFLFWRFYYFFRDPVRKPPPGRVIVSPADGYVVYVKDISGGSMPSPVKEGVSIPLAEWTGSRPFAGEGTLIGIYMTPLSVHYNRAPVMGTISKLAVLPARKKNLSMVRTFIRLIWNMAPFEKKSGYITDNARNTIFIDGEVPMAIVQIADSFVREVDCYVAEGQKVETGSKIGMIRMGSQCDLFIPKSSNIKLLCKTGDKVFAGESVLASY
jgi:phosphatidylserine decarboxylase